MHKIVKIAFCTLLLQFCSQNLFAQETEEVYEGQEEVIEEDENYRFIGDINKPNFVGDLNNRESSRSFDYSKGYNPRDREGYHVLDKSLPMNIEWSNQQGRVNENATGFQMNSTNIGNTASNLEQVNPKPIVSAEMTSQKSIVGTPAAPNNAPRNNDAVPANPDDPGDVPVNAAVYVLVLAGLLLGFKFKRSLQY